MFPLCWSLYHKILNVEFLETGRRFLLLFECSIRAFSCQLYISLSLACIVISIIEFIGLMIYFMLKNTFTVPIITLMKWFIIFVLFFIKFIIFWFLGFMQNCIWFWTVFSCAWTLYPSTVLFVYLYIQILIHGSCEVG